MGMFVIGVTANGGYRFNLKAANRQTIATSQTYKARKYCVNGIKSVQKNAPVAGVEDQTVEGWEKIPNPKFEVYVDKGGEYRFRLKAKNGEAIVSSEGYSKKSSCMNGIKSVQKNAVDSQIVDEEA